MSLKTIRRLMEQTECKNLLRDYGLTFASADERQAFVRRLLPLGANTRHLLLEQRAAAGPAARRAPHDRPPADPDLQPAWLMRPAD